MAKPIRYTQQDRRRKRLHAPFNLSVGALIRHNNKLGAQLAEKALLATKALRRCVELESLLEVISGAAKNSLNQPLPDCPHGHGRYPYSYRQLRGQVEGLEYNLQLERRISTSLHEELAALKKELSLQTARGEPHDGC